MFIEGNQKVDSNNVEANFKNTGNFGIVGKMLGKTTECIETINEFGKFWQEGSDSVDA